MAHAPALDDLMAQVSELERCAVTRAREREREEARRAWSAAATHAAAQGVRAAARRFPLATLAAAFGLGFYVASKFES
jgi:hypothetical protein